MSKRRRDLRRAARRKQKGGPDMDSLSGMSPKAMQKALSNMDTQDIPNVIEVIVRTPDEEIILKNPEVSVMNYGQEIWSVIPQGVERKSSKSDIIDMEEVQVDIEIKPEDVKLIISTANVSEEEAIAALKKSNGDLAAAIMNLK